MQSKLFYYDNGDEKFKDNVPIYINRCVEQTESHAHAHDYIEIAYVASGKGIHLLDGREFTVSRGDLFVINYDVPHEFRSEAGYKDGGLVVYNCIFRAEFIDESLIKSRCFSDISHIFLFKSLFEDETAGNDIRLLGAENAEIEELYEKMYQEYQSKNYGYIEILRAYLVELLVKIFRVCKNRETDSYSERKRAIFDSVIRFMKSHYTQDIKLEELAAMAFLSRNYFCKTFKECTGMKVLEYIQKLRMEEACRLLREKDWKVIEIAENVGYKDLKFFTKMFKKVTGKTPSEYRKLN